MVNRISRNGQLLPVGLGIQDGDIQYKPIPDWQLPESRPNNQLSGACCSIGNAPRMVVGRIIVADDLFCAYEEGSNLLFAALFSSQLTEFGRGSRTICNLHQDASLARRPFRFPDMVFSSAKIASYC